MGFWPSIPRQRRKEIARDTPTVSFELTRENRRKQEKLRTNHKPQPEDEPEDERPWYLCMDNRDLAI
jgi:hypothetical protein